MRQGLPDPRHQETILYNSPKQRYFLRRMKYFQLSSDPIFFFFSFPHNFPLVVHSHQVNLETPWCPIPPSLLLSDHVCAPPSCLSSKDVLGNTIDTSVSRFECKKLKSS